MGENYYRRRHSGRRGNGGKQEGEGTNAAAPVQGEMNRPVEEAPQAGAAGAPERDNNREGRENSRDNNRRQQNADRNRRNRDGERRQGDRQNQDRDRSQAGRDGDENRQPAARQERPDRGDRPARGEKRQNDRQNQDRDRNQAGNAERTGRDGDENRQPAARQEKPERAERPEKAEKPARAERRQNADRAVAMGGPDAETDDLPIEDFKRYYRAIVVDTWTYRSLWYVQAPDLKKAREMISTVYLKKGQTMLSCYPATRDQVLMGGVYLNFQQCEW